jgi:hypothetical protein
VQGIGRRSSELGEFGRFPPQMLAVIREVALDSGHNRHRRAYLQVQGERPHLLSPLGHLGTLCRPTWCVGRNTPPQVGSPELSPVTFSWRHRHQHALCSLPNLFSLLSRPEKSPIIAVVVGCSPAVSPWEGSTELTRPRPPSQLTWPWPICQWRRVGTLSVQNVFSVNQKFQKIIRT